MPWMSLKLQVSQAGHVSLTHLFQGDISDTDLMQLRIFPLGSFPLVRICRTPELLYQTPRNIQKFAYALDVTETAGQSSRPRVSDY
jgi:hypothetical protein